MNLNPALTRRRIILAGVAASVLPRVSLGADAPATLALRNLHTNERCAVVYRAGGEYLPEGLAELNSLLRDHRTGDVHPMQPELFDFLHALRAKLDSREELHIISGYRSPKTNAMLRKNSSRVAKKSLHMRGMAIDVRFPALPLAQVRDAAVSLQRGGVGYYARSNFLHIDVGRVRHWG